MTAAMQVYRATLTSPPCPPRADRGARGGVQGVTEGGRRGVGFCGPCTCTCRGLRTANGKAVGHSPLRFWFLCVRPENMCVAGSRFVPRPLYFKFSNCSYGSQAENFAIMRTDAFSMQHFPWGDPPPGLG